MTILGQNVRAGSREVEIYSIKCFIVVLTPWPADPISILALVRYWEEKWALQSDKILVMIVTQMNWPIIVMPFIMFYFIALIRGKWTPEFSKSSLLEEIPIAGYAKILPRAIPKNLRRWVALTANTSSDFNTLTWMTHFTYLQFQTLMLKKYNFQILFSTFWRIAQLPQLL